jgi:hypothetical protein
LGMGRVARGDRAGNALERSDTGSGWAG